jgi:hypothetical protein
LLSSLSALFPNPEPVPPYLQSSQFAAATMSTSDDPTTAASFGLPPDLFDQTTILSLLSTIALVLVAYAASLYFLPRSASTKLSAFSSAITPGTIRFLFIWHAADALCHFVLEGSFLYHCFFSAAPVAAVRAAAAEASAAVGTLPALPVWPTPLNWLNRGIDHSAEVAYGAQAGGDGFFAQLWMVYARADVRWAGVDVVSRRSSGSSSSGPRVGGGAFFSMLISLLPRASSRSSC